MASDGPTKMLKSKKVTIVTLVLARILAPPSVDHHPNCHHRQTASPGQEFPCGMAAVPTSHHQMALGG
jgi:hypothetical protein